MRHHLPVPLTVALTLVAGCQTMRSTAPPEPPLALLSAGALDLPSDCVPPGTVTVTFTVAPTGQTNDVRAIDVPRCVERALTAWVESFRYAPPGRALPSKIEWLLVTGKREKARGG